MQQLDLIKIWLSITLLAFSANGAARANIGIGIEDLELGLHQGLGVVNSLSTDPQAGSHAREITNTYDANNNVVLTTDKRGINTSRVYDRLNRAEILGSGLWFWIGDID